MDMKSQLFYLVFLFVDSLAERKPFKKQTIECLMLYLRSLLSHENDEQFHDLNSIKFIKILQFANEKRLQKLVALTFNLIFLNKLMYFCLSSMIFW